MRSDAFSKRLLRCSKGPAGSLLVGARARRVSVIFDFQSRRIRAGPGLRVQGPGAKWRKPSPAGRARSSTSTARTGTCDSGGTSVPGGSPEADLGQPRSRVSRVDSGPADDALPCLPPARSWLGGSGSRTERASETALLRRHVWRGCRSGLGQVEMAVAYRGTRLQSSCGRLSYRRDADRGVGGRRSPGPPGTEEKWDDALLADGARPR